MASGFFLAIVDNGTPGGATAVIIHNDAGPFRGAMRPATMAPMKVRVYPLRTRGRRLERPENLDGVPGDLRMYSQVHGTEMHMVARLCTRTDRSSTDRELLPPLFSPELIALGDRALLLRGFQSVDGAAYVQEWRCVLE
jgi:hypothetical protein